LSVPEMVLEKALLLRSLTPPPELPVRLIPTRPVPPPMFRTKGAVPVRVRVLPVTV